jgi:hypothetical protein
LPSNSSRPYVTFFPFTVFTNEIQSVSLLVAAGEGAILAGQAEPHRECSMAVSGDSVAW